MSEIQVQNLGGTNAGPSVLVAIFFKIMMTDKFRNITGGLRFLLGVYQKLFTAGIPVEFNPTHPLFIILSFDQVARDPRFLIEEKILPLIGENKDYFV